MGTYQESQLYSRLNMLMIRRPSHTTPHNDANKEKSQRERSGYEYESFPCNDSVQFQMEKRTLSRRRSRSSDYAELAHFHAFVLQSTAKKGTKIHNARA